jgi:hydrogenase maturation protein HypF
VKAAQRGRIRLRVTGGVQGVGFRPHVYRLALRYRLGGLVGNDSEGVFIEVEGSDLDLSLFKNALQAEAPPAADIQRLSEQTMSVAGQTEFRIIVSESNGIPRVAVSPDLHCCRECREEIANPTNRRFGYPFTNCTNCGPRYTIIGELPYDRASTTMRSFTMCGDCAGEYQDPADRRFHAQPNACPACGPRLSLSLTAIVESLRRGEILAVKGVGGYHLVCDARREATVARLRRGKNRLSKPFAVMVQDLEAARRLAFVNQHQAELLDGSSRPVVLLQSRGVLPDAVAPGLSTVGLMLCYTPLHYLLFSEGAPDALVMTSANQSGLPIAAEEREATSQLRGLVDRFVHHDRSIEVPCDDSVVRSFRGQTLPLRRSRGYAPFPIELPFIVPPTLAVGGQMKGTLCLGRGKQGVLSQHLGELENLQTLHYFQHVMEHLKQLYQLTPRLVCADPHPNYLSSRWARESGLPLVEVQHHHAHLASCMAENGLGRDSMALGIILDGSGYGEDRTVWGGEILRGGYRGIERLAHLKAVPLPGGDRAVKEPWRMALSHLWSAGLEWPSEIPPVRHANQRELPLSALKIQLENQINTVPTSSMGRLFDAVASLLGVCQEVEYEAQAAVLLEQVADHAETGSYCFGPGFDPGPVWEAIITDLAGQTSPGAISMRFHRAVAKTLGALAREHHEGLPVALSGGVFQNCLLLELVVAELEAHGIAFLTHRQVPPNDGGLSLGQLMVGVVRYQEEGGTVCA